ncbi:MAG TPA: HigA family addiction module antitoxin [Pseudolabrys sp.]|nr:HigA family addiction module antitoxin [Pseudolabrys sp.]
MGITLHPSIAVHPGEWLRTDVIEAHGLQVSDAAKHLGITRQTASRLLNAGQALSAEMAIRFEKAFGVKADTLMRMQAAYDLAQARGRERQIKVTRFRAA